MTVQQQRMMVDIASSMGTSNSGSVPVSDASRRSRAHDLNRDGPYGEPYVMPGQQNIDPNLENA
jgi:hypothetical protein